MSSSNAYKFETDVDYVYVDVKAFMIKIENGYTSLNNHLTITTNDSTKPSFNRHHVYRNATTPKVSLKKDDYSKDYYSCSTRKIYFAWLKIESTCTSKE